MPPLKCFSLFLGARNTPGAGKHFTSTDDDQIRSLTFRHFSDGFTILNASGGWFDPARKRFIAEDSRQILVCASGIRSLRRWLNELAGALKQKALLVIEVGAASTFRVQPSARVKKRRVRSTKNLK
jgi:hypothetical protein